MRGVICRYIVKYINAGNAFPVFLGYIFNLGTPPNGGAAVLSVRAWHATSITRSATKVVAGLPLLHAVKGGSGIEPPNVGASTTPRKRCSRGFCQWVIRVQSNYTNAKSQL